MLVTGALLLLSGCGGSSEGDGGSSDSKPERAASSLPSYDTSCPERTSTAIRGSVFNAVPRSNTLVFSVPQGSYDCSDWSGISTPGRAFDGMSLSPGYPEPFRLEYSGRLLKFGGPWTMKVQDPTNSLAISGSERLGIDQFKVWLSTRYLQDTDWGDSSVPYRTASFDDRVREPDSDPKVVKEACSKDPRAFGLGVYKGKLSWLFCYQW